MNRNELMNYLDIPLPEDVMKHKWHGDFEAALRVIDRRLSGDTPEVMRRRLELEKRVLRELPDQYPYNKQQTCDMLRPLVKDFKDEEIMELMDSDYVDWIYINGEPHFRTNVLDNVYKTRPDYKARWVENLDQLQAEMVNQKEEKRILKETIARMKREGGVQKTICLRASLKFREDSGLKEGDKVRVWLPIPAEDAQVKAVRILDDGTEALGENLCEMRIASSKAYQRTIFWEAVWKQGMEFAVTYEYDITAGYIDLWDLEKQEERKKEQILKLWKERYADFDPVVEDDLAQQAPHIVFSPLIRQLTEEITAGADTPLEKARKIYDYITTQLHYSYMRSYSLLPQIPEYAAAGGKGDCGVQALLFITMCRCAGIPARWQSGLSANPAYVGCHDWARFYVEEYGWLFADCSFGGGGKRMGDEEQRRFFFGNLEPFRMPACRRYQSEFDPPMKFMRDDPYDAQIGEAELTDERLHDLHPYECFVEHAQK